ncbi:hypothetical protein CVCC1112_4058 [Paenarthrobacter nicotinovorans]|nr:hypothetical protein CVCC1112_4058 [Paenarthrobacter nicotinovorans]
MTNTFANHNRARTTQAADAQRQGRRRATVLIGGGGELIVPGVNGRARLVDFSKGIGSAPD